MSEEKWFVFHKSTGTPVKWGFVSDKQQNDGLKSVIVKKNMRLWKKGLPIKGGKHPLESFMYENY